MAGPMDLDGADGQVPVARAGLGRLAGRHRVAAAPAARSPIAGGWARRRMPDDNF
jgi:hypothetical protein